MTKRFCSAIIKIITVLRKFKKKTLEKKLDNRKRRVCYFLNILTLKFIKILTLGRV